MEACAARGVYKVPRLKGLAMSVVAFGVRQQVITSMIKMRNTLSLTTKLMRVSCWWATPLDYDDLLWGAGIRE